MNRKGFVTQAVIVLILIVVLVGIMMIYWAWSVSAPFITTVGTEATTIISQSVHSTGDSALINASDVATEATSQSLGWMSTLSVLFFCAILIGFFVIAAMVRTYPFLIGVWIIGVLLLAFFSLFLTTSYQEIYLMDGYTQSVYTSWETNHFIMSNMPIIITVVGIIGGILLFLLIPREESIETGGAL